MKNSERLLSSVNFHLWEPCNMQCKFCFATFQDVKETVLPKGHLSKEESINVVKELAKLGFEKITFAGGEPTLCPWLPELIKTAKDYGLTTMIVTNGSKLTDSFLRENQFTLDWIAISIDSINPETNKQIGRLVNGKLPFADKEYKLMVDRVKNYKYGLKINTVVNRYNYTEEMSDFISYAKPNRWKILQALPVKGQNNNSSSNFEITQLEFDHYCSQYKSISNNINVIKESNFDMIGSYAMVDPAGRFFDNESGKHSYSKSILDVGVEKAISQVSYSYEKFINRGGIYKWELGNKNIPNKITLSGEVASSKSTAVKLLAKKLNYNSTPESIIEQILKAI